MWFAILNDPQRSCVNELLRFCMPNQAGGQIPAAPEFGQPVPRIMGVSG